MIEIECSNCPVVDICAKRFNPDNNKCPLLALLIQDNILQEPLETSSKSYKKIWQERVKEKQS